MKRIAFLLALPLMFTFVACGDDDTDSNASDLVGSWELTGYSNETSSNITAQGTSISTETTSTLEANGNNDVVLTFNDNGTYTQTGSAEARTVSTSDGQTILDQVNDVDFSSSGSYSVSGNRLIGLAATSGQQQVSDQPASAEFSISGDVLTFILDTTFTAEFGGSTSTNTTMGEQQYTRQ